MHAGCTLLVGGAIANNRAAGNQAGLVAVLRGGNGIFNRFEIVPVNTHRIPACGLETRQCIAGLGQIKRSVNCDVIVVIQNNEAGKFHMSGNADGFMADAFHQIAV